MSESSATALLSDLRPTTVQPQALQVVNAFLDELLVTTVTTAKSINPEHFRYRGVQGALGSLPTPNSPAQQASLGPLGRAVVGEAELELRSWYEGHPTALRGRSGFAPDGNGRGMVGAMESAGLEFPMAEAIQLMRLKVAMLSVSFQCCGLYWKVDLSAVFRSTPTGPQGGAARHRSLGGSWRRPL